MTFSYSYDTAGALTGLTSDLHNDNHPTPLLSVTHYNALGQITSATLGNGIVQTREYDNRGLVRNLTDGTVYSANPLSYAANGSIVATNDSVNGNWTFGYDDFNRLLSASKTGDSYTYDYDRFGNRWHQNGIQPSSLSFDANNHIAAGNGVTYDAAGNVTNDGSHSYTYDAENRLVSVDAGSVTYVYDADGQRVRQATPDASWDYLYDLNARVLTALNSGDGSWVRTEIYAGAAHIGTYSADTTYFEHTDWLGTVRVRTGPSGAPVQTCTSEWFGDGQVCVGTDGSPTHYTGHELDAETNLNHFWFRQYSSAQGRWITPDPAGMAAVEAAAPQTWNRYAYVVNSPTNLVDPLGLKWTIYCYGYPENGGPCVYVWVPDPSDKCDVGTSGCQTFPPWGPHPRPDPPDRTSKVFKCLGEAAKSNGVSIALDLAGFIPGEGLAGAITQLSIGIVSTVNSAAHQDASGSFMSIAGIHLTVLAPFAKQAGWSFAKAVPIAGTLLNVVSTGSDLNTARRDYLACMARK